MIGLLAIGFLLLLGATSRKPSPESPESPDMPSSAAPPVFDPGTGTIAPPKSSTTAPGAPSTPSAIVPLSPTGTSTVTQPKSPSPPAGPPPPATLIPQPKDATGNLPNITRPLARVGFNPEEAHKLAPQVYASVVRGQRAADVRLLKRFQELADLWPRDGIYGPRTAGALEYYLARPGGAPPPKTPVPHTRDKRVIPYAL